MSEIKYQPFLKVAKDITSKFTKIKKQDYLENGKYKIIDQSQNFITGYTNNQQFINNEEKEIIIFGDHTRVIKYIDFPIAIGADGVKVLKVDSKIANTKYIYYFLKSVKLHNAGYSRHFKYLKAIKIPIQPLENQRKISAFLTRLEELIEKRKESIKLLDELIKSTFLDMFGDPVLNTKGWDKKILQNMMTIRRGASPRPIKDFIGNDIHWIKIGDGTKGDELYITDTKEKIKMDGKTKSVYLKEGSVIFANCGVSLGFVRILKIDGCIHDGWLSFEKIDNETLNKIFLLKVINFSTKYLRRIASGGTQPNLNTSIMNKFKIIVPPKPLQDKFAKIVTKIEDTKKLYQNSLDELNNLFNSIAQKAFKGEVLK